MSCFNSLIVKVERRTNNPSSPFQKLFERVIEVNDNILVPYDSISSSLRFLYGRDVVVSFSSEIIDYPNK